MRNKYLNSLRKIFENKPLFAIYKTEVNNYLYDTGTNKILKCDNSLFSLLNLILKKPYEEALKEFIKNTEHRIFETTVKNLLKAYENHQLFRKSITKDFTLIPTKKELKNILEQSCNILQLEITDMCNLRCTYCPYSSENKNDRPHGKHKMSFSTAQKAINIFAQNLRNLEDIHIVFYGGEPLLNFNLIKKIIEYIKVKFKSTETHLSLITNATKITPSIASYLYRNKVNVTVSIDGDKESHDRYRTFVGGKNTHKVVSSNINILYETYNSNFYNKIKLSSVYTPPYGNEEIIKRTEWLKKQKWFTYELDAEINYYSGNKIQDVNHLEDETLESWALKEYISKTKQNSTPHPFARSLLEKKLAIISQRPIFSDPQPTTPHMIGCCIPGKKRLYVTTDGKFKMCEKISTYAPYIGSVDSGLNIKLIYEEYFVKYKKMSIKLCEKCWAVNLCKSCFIDGYDRNGLSNKYKYDHCLISKRNTFNDLYYFSKAIELFPQINTFLQNIAIK